MTIDEARALIPPGWVGCEYSKWVSNDENWSMQLIGNACIYAIPAHKPEPRRVPCGEMVVEFGPDGWCIAAPDEVEGVRLALGGRDAVANTKWRLDFDRREWVEVVE